MLYNTNGKKLNVSGRKFFHITLKTHHRRKFLKDKVTSEQTLTSKTINSENSFVIFL